MSGEIQGYVRAVAVLLGVAAFAFIALRKWLPKLSGIGGTAAGPIQVVTRLALEPRKTLYVVRAGSDYLMLAASEAGVQMLAPLDTAGIDATRRDPSAKPGNKVDFGGLLRLRRAKAEESER